MFTHIDNVSSIKWLELKENKRGSRFVTLFFRIVLFVCEYNTNMRSWNVAFYDVKTRRTIIKN